jgi:hypothetical protein
MQPTGGACAVANALPRYSVLKLLTRAGAMASKLGFIGTDRAVLAALKRFPHSELAIHRLMNSSETFRDICDELAEAELAMSKVPRTPPELFNTRTLEWQEVVDRLVAEASAALHDSEAQEN